MIYLLPIDLLYLIKEFFFSIRNQNYSYKNEIQWRNFLNTNKYYFHNVKKGTIYLRLNKYYSVQYLTDSSFREKVTNIMKDPWKQLGIDLSYTSLIFENYDLSCLNGVNYLDLSYTKVRSIEHISRVYELNVNCTDITDISSLTDVIVLNATACLSIEKYLQQSDLHEYPEPKMEKLNLAFCTQLIDVSFCKNLHILNLSRCENIIDVSMLGNVYELNLSGCVRVLDVSMLGKVHTLDLSRCPGIVDISALHSVHTLYLYNCQNIRYGLDSLTNVHELHLSRQNTLNLLYFQKISKLCLSYCAQIISSSLSQLPPPPPPTVRQSSLIHYEAMSPTSSTSPISSSLSSQALQYFQRRQQELQAQKYQSNFSIFLSPNNNNNNSVNNYSSYLSNGMQMIQEIILDHCDTIDDLSALANIPYLSLKCCDHIESINSLIHVKYLTLLGCERISSITFPLLEDLIKLSISFCHGINEIEYQQPSSQQRNRQCKEYQQIRRSIDISYCDGLNQMKILDDLYHLSINDCSNLSNIIILKNLQCLEIKCLQEPDIHCLGIIHKMKIEEIYNDIE
jgi:hypothetical protein